MPSDHKEIINIRSEEIQAILSDPPNWIVRWGITLVFCFTILIVGLAFIIKYPDFVSAKVIITTENPTERIVARFSGPIESIYVSDGDTVAPGQRIATIKNPARLEDVLYLKQILDSTHSNSSEFFFPIDSLKNLLLGDIANSYVDFEQNYIDYQLLMSLKPHVNRLEENRISTIEIERRLNDNIRQRQLLEKELDIINIDFERHQSLYEKDVISKKEFEAKRVELLQAEKNINSISISISQLREAINSASHERTETLIDQQESSARYYAKLLQSFNTLKNSIRDWEYQYILSSSIHGLISFQQIWGANQHVNSGEVIFTVFPINKQNIVGKLVLPSQNAGKVAIGQKVLLKVDNFPYQQYGMLIGTVSTISVSPTEEGNYFVYIDLPNNTVTTYGQKLHFDQELLGNAEIITEDLSVAERIFYKFRDLFKY